MVEPAAPLTVLECFAGIGGLSLGLERAGMMCVGQIEIDPWCRHVLAKHWPDVPRHDDIATAVAWWGARSVDIISGGPPCQPNSLAGKGLAQADPRWLWPHMRDLIAAVRPRAVIIEGVPGLRARGLLDILHDLCALGFHGSTGVLSAATVGAPHIRKRLFTLAYASGQGRRTGRRESGMEGGTSEGFAEPSRPESVGRGWWTTEPGMGRVAYGFPGRLDRLRGLGNAVVPQVAERVGRIVIEQLNSERIPCCGPVRN